MTKRKPRRKAPKKAQRSIGWLWWTAGLLSIGWIAFDANRAAILTAVPQLTALTAEPQARVASSEEPPSPAVQARSAQIPTAEKPAVSVTPPPTRIAAVTRDRAPAEVVPTQRPGARRQAAAGTVTRRATPLLREPSRDAPVWVTLEAGRPVRITARDGEWRRVETGIFTGWINAEFLEAQARPESMPVRAASSEAKQRQLVPPGSIPGVAR